MSKNCAFKAGKNPERWWEILEKIHIKGPINTENSPKEIVPKWTYFLEEKN